MSYVTIVSINLLPSEVAKICSQIDIKNEVNEENAMQVDEIENKLCDKQSLILRSHKKPVHKDIKNDKNVTPDAKIENVLCDNSFNQSPTLRSRKNLFPKT